MKDDLLIRFIDGKTTPEETELVLKELSQDGEAAKEWMQMVQGARLAGTKPLVDIDSETFVSKTLTDRQVVKQTGKKAVRLPWIISGIAAVAASVAVILTVMKDNGNTEIPQNIVAEIPDTTVVMPEQKEIPTPEVEEDVRIEDVARQSVADVVVKQQPVIQPEAEEKPVEIAGQVIQQNVHAATGFHSEVEQNFEMVKPAKSPYRIKVKNPDKEFVFEWKMSGVHNVRFSIADKDGKVLIDNEWISEDHFGVVASDIVDRGELEWTVEVTFNDGSMQRKSGKIELVSVKE